MVLSLIKNRGMELEPFRSFDGGIALTCIIQNLVTSVRHLTYYVISCLYSFTGKYLLDWTSSSVLPTLARKSRGPGVWHFSASFCSLFDLRPVTRQHQRRESLAHRDCTPSRRGMYGVNSPYNNQSSERLPGMLKPGTQSSRYLPVNVNREPRHHLFKDGTVTRSDSRRWC